MINKVRAASIALPLCFFVLSGCSDHLDGVINSGGTVQGSGILLAESRRIGGVDGVILAGVGELHIEQGDMETLRIVGDDNLVPLVETTIEDGILGIEGPGDNFSSTLPLRYFLTVKDLSSVALVGVGNVLSSGLQATTLDLQMVGFGNIDMTGLDVGTLHVGLTGVGNMNLAGTVAEQDIVKSGVGEYDGSGLESTTTDVLLTGIGTVMVNVSDHLTVTINGPGTVQYTGNPTVTVEITGGGHLQHVGD